MSVADDIVDGVVCMQCQTFFVDNDGSPHSFGFPVLCEHCWSMLPPKKRSEGVPYFDEETGGVLTR